MDDETARRLAEWQQQAEWYALKAREYGERAQRNRRWADTYAEDARKFARLAEDTLKSIEEGKRHALG